MTLLVALGSGDPDPWVKQFRVLLPDRPIVKLGDSYDPSAVEFSMTWYHPTGSLAHLPNLRPCSRSALALTIYFEIHICPMSQLRALSILT